MEKGKNKEYWRDDPTFMKKERFFDIPGYYGDYKISNFGNIMSFKFCIDGKALIAKVNRRGYFKIEPCMFGVKKTK